MLIEKTNPKYKKNKTNKLMVENTHLPLPVCSVNKDDILWQMFVRVQDLIELIVHWFPRKLQQEGRWIGKRELICLSIFSLFFYRQAQTLTQTCVMSLDSGEVSLSMLLVRSLWALEFCLSFMDVLRGRRWSLLSALLASQQGERHVTTAGRRAFSTSLTLRFNRVPARLFGLKRVVHFRI